MSSRVVTNHVSTRISTLLFFLIKKKNYSSVRASNTTIIHRDPLNSQISTTIPQQQTNTLDPDLDLPLWGCDVVGTLIESFVASSTPQSTNWVPDSLSPPTIMSVISDLHDWSNIGVWILKTCYVSTSLALVLFLDVAILV